MAGYVKVDVEGIRAKLSPQAMIEGRRALANQMLADMHPFVPKKTTIYDKQFPLRVTAQRSFIPCRMPKHSFTERMAKRSLETIARPALVNDGIYKQKGFTWLHGSVPF